MRLPFVVLLDLELHAECPVERNRAINVY